MKHLLLALILINSSLVCMDEVELIDSEEKKQETALIKSKQSTCASFQKKLRYYASPSTWKKIGFGGCAFILLAGLGTSLYFIVATDDVSDSNGGFTPPPCNQVPWNRLGVPCKKVNYTSTYYAGECQLDYMNANYHPSCVPLCNENDTNPWVFSGYTGYANATECADAKNMTGQNNFVWCPVGIYNWWYEKLLAGFRNRSEPYCEYPFGPGAQGLLIRHEDMPEAVNLTDYGIISNDPKLINTDSGCRFLLNFANGECKGPIVQNSTNEFPQRAARKANNKKKNKKK